MLVESILGYAELFNTPRAPKNQMNTDPSHESGLKERRKY